MKFKSSLAPLLQLIAFIVATLLIVGVQNSLFDNINPYYQSVVINAGIAVVLAVSLNLINGITGQFSLGHAGFMAVGAYISAYFSREMSGAIFAPLTTLLSAYFVDQFVSSFVTILTFSLAILVGAVAAGIAGFFVGLPSLRLRGDYLAIVTLGFNQIIVSLIRNWKEVGGASGYVGIPKYTTFAWVFALALGCIWSIRNLASSALGREMRAIRDDEIAAEASGINTTRIKVVAFVYSAMWAGVAGALQGHYIQYANPNDFTFLRSVEVVVSVVLGGLGSITGSALSALGLTVLQEVLRDVPGAFYTSIALVAIATYWNFVRLRNEREGGKALAKATVVPVCTMVLLCVFYWSPQVNGFLEGIFPRLDLPDVRAALESSKGALRYVIYSIILIVVMLLRPQGLLGRREWSFAALQRGRRGGKEVEAGLT